MKHCRQKFLRPLTELGVWDDFLASGALASPGITAAWGSQELSDNDFMVNLSGTGWHIDRRRFDAMLAEAAEASGAEVVRGGLVTCCTQTCAGVWHVTANLDGRLIERRALRLVDATGRRSLVARRLGVRRLNHDRLVGVWGLLRPPVSGISRDRRTLIEAVESGWWYSALVPDGRHAAGFMTDSDLLPAGPSDRNAFWQTCLQKTAHTQARLGPVSIDSAWRIIPACSARLEVMAGDGWLAVGDAAISFDPLSAQGVTWALESGLAAARAIDASLSGDWGPIEDYTQRANIDFDIYLQERCAIYRNERRWPDSPFWERRHRTSDNGVSIHAATRPSASTIPDAAAGIPGHDPR